MFIDFSQIGIYPAKPNIFNLTFLTSFDQIHLIYFQFLSPESSKVPTYFKSRFSKLNTNNNSSTDVSSPSTPSTPGSIDEAAACRNQGRRQSFRMGILNRVVTPAKGVKYLGETQDIIHLWFNIWILSIFVNSIDLNLTVITDYVKKIIAPRFSLHCSQCTSSVDHNLRFSWPWINL